MDTAVKGTSTTGCHPNPAGRHASREGGFALPAAMAVLVLLSVLVVTVFANAMASFRSGATDLGKTRTHFAAEAGAESAMAQLSLALQDAVIEDAELAAMTPPTLAPFTYDSFSVTRLGGIVSERITDGPFTGLLSLTQMVDIYSEARDPDFNSSAVVVTAKAQAIPIFQFGVFYEKDLEIDNLPLMTFAGWVHSNGSIWTGPTGSGSIYEDIITTPNKYYWDAKAAHVAGPDVWIDDATGVNTTVNSDSRTAPNTNANNFRNWSNTRFDDRLKTDAYGVDTLRVPLPTGVDPYEVISPRLVADGTLERAAKFSWKADLYITIDLSRIPNEATALLETQRLCKTVTPPITYVRDVGLVAPDSLSCTRIFDYEHDDWYDEREQRYVNSLDVNVDSLQAWAMGLAPFGAAVNRRTAIVYIHMTTPVGTVDPRGGGHYPILRLVGGAQLDTALTVATRHPIYTQGNYNSVGWWPAALVGDAFTVLSPAWNDTQHQIACQHRRAYGPYAAVPNCAVQPSAQSVGSATAVYAAVLAGHSRTACDHSSHGGPTGSVNNGNCQVAGAGSWATYGGGLENFPRFLEDFRTTNTVACTTTPGCTNTVTYVGSLVSLAYNQQGTGAWVYANNTTNTGQYYSPPERDWQFDTRFEYPENLPPGTPVVGNVIHTAFRPIF
jgi:hypothetical protein